MYWNIVGFLCFVLFCTLHGEEKDGVSTLYEVPALGSGVGEVHCSTEARSPMIGQIVVGDFKANLAWIIPKEFVGPCLIGW